MNRRHAAVREHCGHGCCRLRLVHNVPRTLSAVYTDAFLTRFIVFHALMGFCVRPPRFPCNLFKRSHNTQILLNHMPAGSRDVILLQQYLTESVFLLHMKNKEKWIASMGRQWPPPPLQRDTMHKKWLHLQPDVTARTRINFSSVFSALELFLPSALECKRFNSLCDLPVDLAKKHHRDLMLGLDLEYLRNYKASVQTKDSCVSIYGFFFLVMLLEMQYLKFRFKLQKCVQELVNWANSCSLCHQLSTQEPLMITCERFQSCKMKLQ